MQRAAYLTIALLFASHLAAQPVPPDDGWSAMRPIVPRGYVVGRASGPVHIDGLADEPAWKAAPWTRDFVDIQGPKLPKPRFRTRAKLLWDDRYLYVYAELEEPHVQATITKRNEVIFHDNDFEVFINPDGNNHNYYEYEMNAFNTIWELSLERPYRDDGPVHLGTNMPGLISAVHVAGTINQPSDIDHGWSVEIAFPWTGLARYADRVSCPPHDGDQWRLGFSRVEWHTDVVNGTYRKVPGLPEDNWVWSPQGVIDMHRPERWGYIQFSTAAPGVAKFRPDPSLPARDLLMEIYHLQRGYRQRFGRYAASLDELGLKTRTAAGMTEPVRMESTRTGYTATAEVRLPGSHVHTLHVREDSLLQSD